MKNTVADRLSCRSCHQSLVSSTLVGSWDSIDYGVLVCPQCLTGLPILAGFLHTDQPMLADIAPSLSALKALEHSLMPRLGQYDQSLLGSGKRSYDSYAAFQPFNESTRAIYPLLEHIRQHLKPGDLILDTWCRTGFSGALLAGLFPQQHVLSLWEGNLGVLGHEGFHRWLGTAARASNWDIAFAQPGRGLPFLDGSFAFVNALDSLHRYPFDSFLSDCLRTAMPGGAIVFAHVHLANSEPSPYFERGGVQLHGEQYRSYFARVLAGGGRCAYVLSESDLFELEHPTPLLGQSQTPNYNGLIAILDKKCTALPLSPRPPIFFPHERPLRQPMLVVDQSTGAVRIDRERAGELLDRHPCYAKRLDRVLPAFLSPLQVRIWCWVEAGASWDEIGVKLDLNFEELRVEAELLERAEMLLTLPLGSAMHQLQTSHADREIKTVLVEQCFAHLWAQMGSRYQGREVLRADDGSAFGCQDVQDIVNAIGALFAARGVTAGSRVAVVSGAHAEAILAVWACWLCGAAVVPIDPALPAAQRDALIDRLRPSLLLLDEPAHERALSAAPVLNCFDLRVPSQAIKVALGDLIADYFGKAPPATALLEGAAAAILLTSGSTGQPKGVILSHGALYRGARTLAQAYGVGADDVLTCPGGLHTMSGLRNNCLLPLFAGATLAALDVRAFSHPALAAQACRRHDISVLSVVPAFVHAVRATSAPPAFGRLRQILCTGTTLTLNAQREVEQTLGAPIHMYYGLTETGGVCALAKSGMTRLADGDIGMPANAHLRLVDETGQCLTTAGATGEIEVFNCNLMLGYIDDEQATRARMRNGWLRTGDLARIEDGHFILCGRIDDMFKTRQGLALHPGVIEELLCTHCDVAEAAVVAIDSQAGQRLHAWLITRKPMADEWAAEIHAWLSERLNPQYMPDRLHVVRELPRVANGKIARSVLREQWSAAD